MDGIDIGVADEAHLESIHQQYDGNLTEAAPGEVAEVFDRPEDTEFYRDLKQNDNDLWRELTGNLDSAAHYFRDDLSPVAADGGEEDEISSGSNLLYEKVANAVEEHPVATKVGAAATVIGALGAGYALTNSDGSPSNSDTGIEKTTTPGGDEGTPEETSSPETPEDYTLEDVNKSLSNSNMTDEVLVDAYLEGNISQDNRQAVYDVFGEDLLNGTELSSLITDNEGDVEEEYIEEEYRSKGSETVLEEGTDISDILDEEQIFEDIEDESQQTADLQQELTQAEEWYENSYEEQLATEIAENRTDAKAENVTVDFENGNYSVNGTFVSDSDKIQQQVNITASNVTENKADFRTVLEGLNTVRTLEVTQDANTNQSLNQSTTSVNETSVNNSTYTSDNQTSNFTDRFFQELENGNFKTIQDARTVGQAYEESSLNATSNVTEATVLGGYLENETTARELSYLDQAHQENSTDLVNMTADPLSDDWSGDGADNLALLDLGLDPLENHGVLNEYNITRTETREDAENNTYRVIDGEDLNSTVNSGQLDTFSPAMQAINEEFNNPQEADSAELLDNDISRRGQMEDLTGFAFEYMDNESHTDTVTDMANMAVIDERDTGDYGPGLSEKIAYFQTFDEAWNSQGEAFQFARLMVDEENLEYADEAGLQLLDAVYSQAMEDGRFQWDNDERLTEDRLEELENEATDWNGNLEEPDIEPDEIEELDSGGFSTSSNDGGNDGGSDDGGGDDGNSGGSPPNGGGGPGGR